MGRNLPSRVQDCLACVAPLETPSVTDKLKVYFKGRAEGEDGHGKNELNGGRKQINSNRLHS